MNTTHSIRAFLVNTAKVSLRPQTECGQLADRGFPFGLPLFAALIFAMLLATSQAGAADECAIKSFVSTSAGLPTSVNGGDVNDVDAGDVYVYPAGFSPDYDVRMSIVEVNGPIHFQPSGPISILLHSSGGNEFVVADMSVVEAGSVTPTNLTGAPITLFDAEVGVYDMDASNGSNFSDVGGIDNGGAGVNVKITGPVLGSSLSPLGLLSGGPSGSFDFARLTIFGTNNFPLLNPDFAIVNTYSSLMSERVFFGVTGPTANATRGGVLSMCARHGAQRRNRCYPSYCGGDWMTWRCKSSTGLTGGTVRG